MTNDAVMNCIHTFTGWLKYSSNAASFSGDRFTPLKSDWNLWITRYNYEKISIYDCFAMTSSHDCWLSHVETQQTTIIVTYFPFLRFTDSYISIAMY